MDVPSSSCHVASQERSAQAHQSSKQVELTLTLIVPILTSQEIRVNRDSSAKQVISHDFQPRHTASSSECLDPRGRFNFTYVWKNLPRICVQVKIKLVSLLRRVCSKTAAAERKLVNVKVRELVLEFFRSAAIKAAVIVSLSSKMSRPRKQV